MKRPRYKHHSFLSFDIEVEFPNNNELEPEYRGKKIWVPFEINPTTACVGTILPLNGFACEIVREHLYAYFDQRY